MINAGTVSRHIIGGVVSMAVIAIAVVSIITDAIAASTEMTTRNAATGFSAAVISASDTPMSKRLVECAGIFGALALRGEMRLPAVTVGNYWSAQSQFIKEAVKAGDLADVHSLVEISTEKWRKHLDQSQPQANAGEWATYCNSIDVARDFF